MALHPAISAVTATLAAAVVVTAASIGMSSSTPPPGGAGVNHAVDPAQQWAERTVHRMTLPEKVGQLFTTYVHGTSADQADPGNRAEFGVDTPAEVVRKYHLGGIIYFAKTNGNVDNIRNPTQVATLSNGLQQAATDGDPGIPLLISTDQEEGRVTRITAPATEFPGNMALGATRSAADARTAAAITGGELRAMGINVDNAPDADVNVNPANPVIGVRSFGSDPALVSELTAAQIDGYQNGDQSAAHADEQRAEAGTVGVAATVKHFPGHGDTDVDSHTGLPVINHDKAAWEKIDAPPFRAAIQHGVDMIMTAHLLMPKLDPSGEPATLSPTLLTGLLRQELGYRGVITTDSLQMAGVRQKHPDGEIPVLALKAGADQLMMPAKLGVAIDGVLGAVRSGQLTEQRIDESVLRLLELKFRRGIVAQPQVDSGAVAKRVGSPENHAAAQRITDATTTVLTNGASLLPPARKPKNVLITGYSEDVQQFTAKALAAEFTARGARATVDETGTAPDPAAIAGAVAGAKNADLTVVLTNSAATHRQQQDLLRQLAATGAPVVAVAVNTPSDAASVPQVRTWLATYSANAVAMRSLAKVLYGEVRPAGRLPVGIPDPAGSGTDRFPFGHGLTW